MTKTLEKTETVRALGEKLGYLESVRRCDSGSEKQGHVIAQSLQEIEESMESISKTIGCLVKVEHPERLWELLHDVGEDFRHIQYHIKDCKYFGYLDGGGEDHL